MPHSSESLTTQSARNQLGLAVLDFISRTSAFEQEFHRRLRVGEITQRDLMIIGMELSEPPSSIIAGSRQLINECLEDLGGIPHFIDDSATGLRLPCTYISWHGNSPTGEGQHVWKAQFGPLQGIQEVTVSRSLLDEVSERFQQ